VLLAGASIGRAQVIAADWVGLGVQDWTVPAAWNTGAVPNNIGAPAGVSYAVRFIQPAATNYTARITSNVTLDSLEINSSRATLQLNAGELSVGTGTVTTGALQISSTLKGGSWTIGSSATALLASSNSVLDAVTISSGVFKINSGVTATIRNGLTMGAAGQLSFTTPLTCVLRADGTQTISGGLLSFGSGTPAPANLKITSGSTLTLSGVALGGQGYFAAESGTASLTTSGSTTFQAGQIRIGSSISSFTNSGTLTLSSGQTLLSEAISTVNTGSFVVTGGSLQLNGNWHNAGTISFSSGSISLGGSFATPEVASINQTGGTLNITGAWNNTGSTYQIGAGGSLLLNSTTGATITGGTIAQTPTGRFIGGRGTIDGVTVTGGDLRLTGFGLLQIHNGLTLTGGDIHIVASGSGLIFDAPFTLDSYDIVSEVTSSSGGNINLPATGTFTVGPGHAIRGGNTLIGPTSTFNPNVGTILNLGRIAAEGSGRVTAISTTNLTNAGVMEATGGASLNIASTTFTNQGIINALDGRVLLASPWTSPGTINLGGTGTLELASPFSTPALSAINRTGGTFALSTTWNNAGQTFDLTPFGPIQLNPSSTIQGGTIRQNAANRLIGNSGFLDNVTIDGGLSFALNETINVTGGGVHFINGGVSFNSNASLRFFGTHTLDNISIVTPDPPGGTGTIGLVNGAILTLGPGVSITGPGSIVSQVTTGGPYTFGLDFHGSLDIAGGPAPNFIPRTYTISVPNGVSDGVMRAGSSGTLNLQNLTNNGLLEAGSGGLVTLGPGCSNGPSGTIRALAGGRVQIGQSTTFTDDILGGSIIGQGGDIEIAGIWNHAGRSLTLNAQTGSWKLRNGTINGGEIVLADGQTLRLAPYTSSSGDPGGGTINNLTISGGDWIASGGGASLSGAIAIPNGNIVMRGAGFSINTSFALATPSQIIAESGTNSLSISRNGVFVTPSMVVRGAGLTMTGTYSTITWENAGLISADRPGTLTIQNTGSFVNSGIIEARGGGSLITYGITNNGVARVFDGTLELGDTFSGTGQIQVAPQGTLNLGYFSGAGTNDLAGLSNAGGGTVNLVGTWDNTGRTFAFTPTTGNFNLGTAEPRFGTIRGGTLDFTGGRGLVISHGTLDNVRIMGGGLSIPSGGQLAATNGLVLDGPIQVASNGQLNLNGTGDAAGIVLSGIAVLASSPITQPVSTIGLGNHITLDSSCTIRGGNIRFIDSGFSSFAQFNGSVIADMPGASIAFSTTVGVLPWINNGTFRADSGRIFLGYRSTAANFVFVSTSNYRLDGGTWIAANGGVFDIDPLATLVGNTANVSIIGATSRFDALRSLRSNAGLLTLDQGAALALTPTSAFLNSGTLTIGEQSSLGLAGPLTLAPASILQIEIGSPADDFHLSTAGPATLDGQLRLILPLGATPHPGDLYRILRGQSLAGDFAATSLPALPNGWTFQPVRDGQSITFQVVPAPTGALIVLLGCTMLAHRRR
jgi:hypothetical protein